VLRLAVKQHFGIRSEKLAELSLQPFRGRKKLTGGGAEVFRPRGVWAGEEVGDHPGCAEAAAEEIAGRRPAPSRGAPSVDQPSGACREHAPPSLRPLRKPPNEKTSFIAGSVSFLAEK
jgi:hypothetical protein